MPPHPLRPPGVPLHTDDIVAYRPDGTPITAAERIVQAVRQGSYLESAAQAAHVEIDTLRGWLAKGADANKKKAAGITLGSNEKRFARFASDVYQAEAAAEVEDIATLRAIGIGGLETDTVTVRYDEDGNEVGRTVKTERLAPNVQALTWHAERRWAGRWNRRQQIEITGEGGGPVRIESPLGGLMAELAAMERRLGGVVETTGVESPALPAGDPPDDWSD